MTTASVVVRCANLLRHIYPTIVSVKRQDRGPDQIIVVADPSTGGAVRDWLEAFALAGRIRFVEVDSSNPGAVWSGAIETTNEDFIVCLDAGDEIEPNFLGRCLEELQADPYAVAMTSLLELGPGSQRREVPAPKNLDDLLGGIYYSRRPFLLRRGAWERIGKFDTALPTMEDFDLLIRLLGTGQHVAAIAETLAVRGRRYDGIHRREWERRGDAMEQIWRKHANLFLGNADLIERKQERLNRLRDQHRILQERHDTSTREIDRAKSELADAGGAIQFEVDRDLMRRTTPISLEWGSDRGNPVDRFYIERFLEEHASDIAGVVLEVDNPDYTKQYGGSRVTRSDVLDIEPSNQNANVIADLRRAPNIGSGTYDCVILTQTVHIVDDIAAVVAECERILAPGGVLLVTLPASSRICIEYGFNGDFWRFTAAGARRLFGTSFPQSGLEVAEVGNALSISAFAFGLAVHEVEDSDLAVDDPYLPLLVTVRATKPPLANRSGVDSGSRAPAYLPGKLNTAAILLYHRVADGPTGIHRMTVTPEDFRRQMAVLSSDFCPMSLTELLAALEARDIPEGAVAVTFDDGYLDNLTNASPILADSGVPATFFLTYGPTDGREFWWDSLEWLLLSKESGLPSHIRINLAVGPREFSTCTTAERLAAHADIYQVLQSSMGATQDQIIGELLKWSPEAGTRRDRLRMTGDEISDLATRPGHEVGSHTSRHLLLLAHPIETRRHEIQENRGMLETLLRRPVTAFAYPFGSFDDETVSLVRDLGFECALSCEAVAVTVRSKALLLPRFEVARRREPEFGSWLRRAIDTTVSQPALG